jgi:CheY-like chemotaxis protein
MNKQRVLVLDDHEAILEVVTEALRYEQFEVLGIREGRQFVKNVAEFIPHLILLDYQLADANGGDLCSQLKQLDAYRHIPIVIFSAYFNPG